MYSVKDSEGNWKLAKDLGEVIDIYCQDRYCIDCPIAHGYGTILASCGSWSEPELIFRLGSDLKIVPDSNTSTSQKSE